MPEDFIGALGGSQGHILAVLVGHQLGSPVDVGVL